MSALPVPTSPPLDPRPKALAPALGRYTAKQLALSNKKRKSITFTGDLAAAGIAIYFLTSKALGDAPPVATTGPYDYAVGAGIEKTFSINTDSEIIVQSAWFGISDTATKIIGVSES